MLDEFFTSITGVQQVLLVAAFSIARMAGMVLIFPLFTRMPLTGIIRNGVLLAFAIPILPMISNTITTSGMTTTFIVIYLMKEAVLGVTIGLVLGIPFWAAEGAGEVLDLQRGTTLGTLIDPMMTHEVSAPGTFMSIIMIVIFLAAGGFELTLDTVYRSYEIWPVDQLLPIFGADAANEFLALLSRLFSMAVTLIFPLLVSMLIADIALAFLARAAPSFNIFALSLVVKAVVFSVVFVLYAGFLLRYMSQDLEFLRDGLRILESISCQGC